MPKIWVDMSVRENRDNGTRAGFWIANFSSEHSYRFNKQDLATGQWITVPGVSRERRIALSLGKKSEVDNTKMFSIHRVQYVLTPTIVQAVQEAEEELENEPGVILVARELMEAWVRDGRYPGRLKNPRMADKQRLLYHWNIYHEPPIEYIQQVV